jgi:tetratricopeptide (TPR) repeat protein
MKNPLRALFLPLVAFMLLTSSACDNAADTSKNTLLSTGAKIGKDAMQGSMAEFTKAIKLDPKSAKAYAGRGALKYAMGDSKGAILDLTKAIELNPKSVSAYSGRGSAKFATGDTPVRLPTLSVPDGLCFFRRPAVSQVTNPAAIQARSPALNPARAQARSQITDDHVARRW